MSTDSPFLRVPRNSDNLSKMSILLEGQHDILFVLYFLHEDTWLDCRPLLLEGLELG